MNTTKLAQTYEIELSTGETIQSPAPVERHGAASDGSGRGWDEINVGHDSGIDFAALTRSDGETFWRLELSVEDDQEPSTAERQNELALIAIKAASLLLRLNGAALPAEGVR